MTHQAESTTNTAVSQGCSKAGAASTSARSRSSREAITVTAWTLAGRARLLLVINGRASGIEDPHASARALVAVLEEQGAGAEAVVTASEQELWDALRHAAALGQRVVLVGGDGTLHAAANAPLGRLPELALIPAGRANNIARALGIPTSRVGALAVAASAPAQPVDALRVVTPERSLYALEAVSAGFHAEARAGYRADNSADLRQGLRALVGALRRFRPYRAVRPPPGQGDALGLGAAQLFSRTCRTSASASRSTRAPTPPTGASRRSCSRRMAGAGCWRCSPRPGAAGTSASAACVACRRAVPG